MSRRRAVAPALLILVVAAACEEQAAARPSWEQSDPPCTEGCGAGGASEPRGPLEPPDDPTPWEPDPDRETPEEREQRWTQELGSCNPELAKPVCLSTNGGLTGEPYRLQRCAPRADGSFVWEAVNCDRLSMTCEDGTYECVPDPGNIYCDFDRCAAGDPPICAPNSYNAVATCQRREIAPECGGKLFHTYYFDHRCGPGELCRDGACVPQECDTERCACPADYVPACGQDGRVYWNDCWRSCAGVSAGEGCLQDEIVLAGDLGRSVIGAVGLESGRLLVAETNDRLLEAPRQVCVLELEILDGVLRASEELCRTQVMGGFLDAVAFGDRWLVLSDPGFEAFFTFVDRTDIVTDLRGLDTTYSSQGHRLQRVAETVLFANDFRLSTVSMDAEGNVLQHVAQTFQPFPDGLDSPPSHSDFVQLADGRILYAQAYASEAQVHEVFLDPVRREWRTTLGTPRDAIGTVLFWGRAGEEALVLQAMRTNLEVNFTTIVDEVLQSGCYERRLYGTLVSRADQQAFQFRKADVDGDGADEILASSGSQLLVLARAPNGFMFVRGELSLDPNATTVDLATAELDGDGRAEIVLMELATRDPANRHPTTQLLRVLPHAPPSTSP